MLSFFLSPYCAPAPIARPTVSFKPNLNTLFRLLDDFDNYHPSAVSVPQRYHCQRQHQLRRQTQTFKPRFGVRETESAYELYGELPGIERDNLEIQFIEPQTILVRGRVERTYDSRNSEPQQAEESSTEEVVATPQPEERQPEIEADETFSIHSAGSSASSQGWHHATVEDDPEEPATPKSEPETVQPAPATPATTTTEIAPVLKPTAEPVAIENTSVAASKTQSRVRMYERSISEFTRSFTFPSPVETDAVTASLENGALTVVMPKAKLHQTRRIAIF